MEIKNVMACGNYYQGAREAFRMVLEDIAPFIRGENGILVRSELKMVIQSLENVERYMNGEEVRFRGHKKRQGKLTEVEAYFLTNKTR